MASGSSEEFVPESASAPLVDIPEIQLIFKIITAIGWFNLLIGLPSVLLVLSLKSLSLFLTGLLSLLTFWLLQTTVRNAAAFKSWTELILVVICGVYFPGFVVWLCMSNLIEAILSSS